VLRRFSGKGNVGGGMGEGGKGGRGTLGSFF